MSLILCYVEPRFALVAADLQVTSVYPDGSKKYMHSADKVIASEGAILAISGQERVSRPARRVLATEGALSGTGIRNALTNVRRHLLGGGTKARQQRDIDTTRKLWREYRRRKRPEE